MEISIATLNVHMWADGDYHPNYDRVLKIVKVKLRICVDKVLIFRLKEYTGSQKIN